MRVDLERYARLLQTFAGTYADEASHISAGGRAERTQESCPRPERLRWQRGSSRLCNTAAVLDATIHRQAGADKIDELRVVLLEDMLVLLEGIRNALH